MVSKMSTVEEETDETLYWLEVLTETGMLTAARVQEVTREAQEILAMTHASIRTLRNLKSKI